MASPVAIPASLMRELAAQADFIRAQVKMTVLAIIKTGGALIAVKGKLQHGQFSAWVESECGFTLRTAENYIKVAEFAEGKNETLSLLPPAILYKLTAKSTPPALVQEVMERVESGERVHIAEIDAALAEVRFQRRKAERNEKDAARRARKSKKALAQQEARRRAEEKRREEEEEKLKLRALALLDAIGDAPARLVIEALCGVDGWQVVDRLRQVMSERETARDNTDCRSRPLSGQAAALRIGSA